MKNLLHFELYKIRKNSLIIIIMLIYLILMLLITFYIDNAYSKISEESTSKNYSISEEAQFLMNKYNVTYGSWQYKILKAGYETDPDNIENYAMLCRSGNYTEATRLLMILAEGNINMLSEENESVYNLCLEYDVPPDDNYWKFVEIKKLAAVNDKIRLSGSNEKDIAELNRDAGFIKYKIANNKPPYSENSVYGLLKNTQNRFLLSFFVSIISVLVVSEEKKWNVKNLIGALSYKRSETITAKIIILILISAIFVLIQFGISFSAGIIFMKKINMNAYDLVEINNHILAIPALLYCLGKYVTDLIVVICGILFAAAAFYLFQNRYIAMFLMLAKECVLEILFPVLKNIYDIAVPDTIFDLWHCAIYLICFGIIIYFFGVRNDENFS